MLHRGGVKTFCFFFAGGMAENDIRWNLILMFGYEVGPYDRYKWSYGAPING